MKTESATSLGGGEDARRSVRPTSLFSAFMNSFLLQAGYNYDGYQSIGLTAMLLSALRDLYPDPDERTKALRRHLSFFNAHPYMAGFATGALIRAEEERANEEPGALDDMALDRVRQAMGSLLGNIGDRFFWAGLLPLSALLGMIVFLIEPLYGAICLLLVFNVPHLLVRAEGIRLGYQGGREVLRDVGGPLGTLAISWVRRLAALAAGVLLALTIAHTLTPAGSGGALLVALPALAVSWLLGRNLHRLLALLTIVTLISLYCLLI